MVAALGAQRPVLPPEITERFAARRANLPQGAKVLYRPALLGQAKCISRRPATGVDVWQDVALLLPVDDAAAAGAVAERRASSRTSPDLETAAGSRRELRRSAGELSRPKRYSELATALKDHLYRNRKLQALEVRGAEANLAAGRERGRIPRAPGAARPASSATRRSRSCGRSMPPKIAALQERIRKAEIKVEKEKSQASQQTLSAALSIGTSILGAMFGRKLTSTATSPAPPAPCGRRPHARERQDISDAAEGVEALQQQLADLEAEVQAATTESPRRPAARCPGARSTAIQPKKTEINVSGVTLVWQPWIVRMDGAVEPGV